MPRTLKNRPIWPHWSLYNGALFIVKYILTASPLFKKGHKQVSLSGLFKLGRYKMYFSQGHGWTG